MSEEQRVKVLIVAANPLARIGLAALLGTLADCLSVGAVGPEVDLTALTEQFQAEVILWDMGWDMLGNVDHLRQLHQGNLSAPIVALLPDESNISHFTGLGLAGLLWQTSPPEQLAAGLRAVAEGLAVYDPEFLPNLPGLHETLPNTDLTAREKEVLQLLAQGLANKAIARQLEVSDHTIKFHVNAIMTKLAAQSRTEAVIKAMKLGLVVL